MYTLQFKENNWDLIILVYFLLFYRLQQQSCPERCYQPYQVHLSKSDVIEYNLQPMSVVDQNLVPGISVYLYDQTSMNNDIGRRNAHVILKRGN